jgi:ribokinase
VALINIGRDGQNNIVAVPGANGKVSGRDVRRNTALLRKAGMILAQLEIPLDAMEALAGFARKNDIPLMLDPAPARELPTDLLRSTTWITPNESETRVLCGLTHYEPVTPATAARCADLLMARGPRNVVIKMGVQGAYIATENGIAVSLLSGKRPLEAARFAAAVAAVSVTRKGAQPSMPTNREVDKFLKKQA